MNEVLQKITDAELEIMQVLWDAGEPLSIPQIRQALRRSQPWEAPGKQAPPEGGGDAGEAEPLFLQPGHHPEGLC